MSSTSFAPPVAANTGIATTLAVLTNTVNAAADAALLPALDARDPVIQEGALLALLDRRSEAGGLEILRRLPTLSTRWKQLLFERRTRLSKALREAILGSDPALMANSCKAAVWFREYDLIAPLLTIVEDVQHPQRQLAATTMLELVDLLYAELAGPRDYHERRDPQLLRKHTVDVLEHSVNRFSQHKCVPVLEGFLTLAERENALLKRILSDPLHQTYLPVVEMMAHSPRPGVLRLLLSFLDDPRPPSAALTIVGRRGDLKFVRHFVQRVGDAVSPTHAQNLKRIETIAWTAPEGRVLPEFDDAEQRAAVSLILATACDRQKAFKTLQWLLENGTAGGRRAAAQRLAEFPGVEANAQAQAALDDPDPEVQAHILRQLRPRGTPGALPRLLAAIDSPHEVVRQAARESLTEFSFARFLASFAALDESVQRSTGRLVKKIDPQSLPLLSAELSALSRTRRLRGLELVPLLDAAADVEPLLLLLLEDEDFLVREKAVQALAEIQSPRVRDALEHALSDRSHRVQEAAREALGLDAIPSSSPDDLRTDGGSSPTHTEDRPHA